MQKIIRLVFSRNRLFYKLGFLLLAGVVLTGWLVHAETIRTKDGKVYEGNVMRETDDMKVLGMRFRRF